jgi:predicted CXXCH cytochrome family protein
MTSLLGGGYLAFSLFGPAKDLYLPGATTPGHGQIELACTTCHGQGFGGTKALQEACMRCHGAELEAVRDSHPKSKFTDPRHAERVAVLDARLCVTCHREHRPEITGAMGVTLPADLCFYCHRDIGEERPSHRGLSFAACASAGCHNFHDNTALYEDFLTQHLNEPDTAQEPVVPVRNLAQVLRARGERWGAPVGCADADAPPGVHVDAALLAEWEATAHARAGINCGACHRERAAASGPWTDKPGDTVCARCHAEEVQGFQGGKHGMRLAVGLPPIRPALARQPMAASAHDKTLGCSSCHGAHGFDTRHAAVEACLGCHDDTHTRAYQATPHYRLWQQELAGQGPAGSGVSCATCHLPREVHREDGLEQVRVQHNQNLNLRPNEKMTRGVCLYCHGLGLTLDALADRRLIDGNFNGRPTYHVQSLEWAQRRLEQGERSSPAMEERL